MKTQMFDKMKYDLRGHFSQNHFSTFVYGPILMKIFMNANIIKTQLIHKIEP